MSDNAFYEIQYKARAFSKAGAKISANAAQYRQKAKTSLSLNRLDEAKLYAEQFSRMQVQAQQMKVMGIQLECAASSMKMNQAINDSAGVLESINTALSQCNLDPVKACMTMMQFNQQLEQMNINVKAIENSMNVDVHVDEKAVNLLEELKGELANVDFTVQKAQQVQEAEKNKDQTIQRLLQNVNNM